MKATFERSVTQEAMGVIENAAAMLSMDNANRYLCAMLPEWFIYHGGSHIAIHLKSKGPRYAIITD